MHLCQLQMCMHTYLKFDSDKWTASQEEKNVSKISDRYFKKLMDQFAYIQTDGRKDSKTKMTKLIQLVMLIIYICTIYIIGSPTFRSGCYKLRGKLNVPCSGYKNSSFQTIAFSFKQGNIHTYNTCVYVCIDLYIHTYVYEE